MQGDATNRTDATRSPTASGLRDLGPRGEGWVAGQVTLIALAVALGFIGPAWPGSVADLLIALGAVIGFGGVILLVSGAAALGSALTAMPRPRQRTRLRRGGALRRCRHRSCRFQQSSTPRGGVR